MAKLGSTNIYGDLNVTGKFRVTDVSLFTGLITFENGLSGTTGYYTSNVGIAGNLNVTGSTTFSSTVTATRFISTQATGTAPFTVSSTTLVSNLNADLLDGFHLDANGSNGGPWGFVPLVTTDGSMGVGRYVDFHHVSNDGTNYKSRLHTDGVTDGQLFINDKKIWHSGNSNLTSIPWSASTLTLNGSLSGVSTINSSGLATLGSLSTTTGVFSSTLNVSGVTTLGSSLNVSGSAVFSSTLGVNGVLTSNAGIIIEGSVNPSATNMGGFRTVGTNLILKGNSTGVSGIFFQSEKDGTNINHSSDYGFIQFHAYGVDGSSGESNRLVIGVANDTTDKLVLQTAYNNNVVVSYQDSTAGTSMPEYVVYHAGNSNLSSVDWTAKSFTSYSSGGTKSVKIFVDDNGNLVVDGNLYATGEVSAYGLGQTGGTGGGTSYSRLDLWADYSVDKSGYVLSAYLGNDLNSRLSAIEGNGATLIETVGVGNAVTSVSKSGNLITFTKGSTFLTSINSLIQDNLTYSTAGTTYGLSAYQGYVLNRNDITAISASTTALTLTRASGNITTSIPTWNQNTTGSAGSVANSLTLTITGGTTEGTNKYTFNGSVAKTLNFVAGSNVSIVAGSGSMTISATDTIYTHPTQSAISVGGTRHFITSLGVNTLGHVTGATSTAMTKTDIETLLTGTISTHTHQFSDLTSKPTTLSGYGITDALNTSSTSQTKSGALNIGGSLSVTGDIAGVSQQINTVKNNLGTPTVEEMALFHGQFNNKFRFIKPILQEHSTDNITWVTSTRATTDQLGDMVIGEGQGTSFSAMPSNTVGSQDYYRLTWDATQTGYIYLNHLYVYCSTNGNNINFKVEAYHNTNGWGEICSGTTNNWPGHVSIRHTSIAFSTSASQYGKIRIVFSRLSASNTNAFTLYGIEWFGGYPAGRRNAEYYDRNKNVTFPANVTASSFVGNASSATKVTSVLTRGSYLTGSNYDGSAATTWAVDATTTNTASKIVARDGSGNFSAGTITATLTGNASSATKLATSRTIWGQSFNGEADVNGTVFTNTGVKSRNICIETDNLGNASTASSEINNFNSTLFLQQSSSNNIAMCGGGGKVGIGRTNTLYGKLEVSGVIRGNAESDVMDTSSWTAVNANYILTSSAGWWGIRAATNHSFNIDVTSNGLQSGMINALRILTNGNVGIGTTDPQYKLDVNGTFRSTGDGYINGNLYLGSASVDRTILTRVVSSHDSTTLSLNPWGGNVVINNNIAWHAGNDGAGSGLDADLLDGVHYQNILERRHSGSSASGTATGWFRIGALLESNADGHNCILKIKRNYDYANNESYVFSISSAYNGGISITQLSGYANYRLIDKVRIDYTNSGVSYIELHIATSTTNNHYGWTTIGQATSYTTWTAVSDTPVGTSYEFTTVNGCKSDRGFTGNLSGNSSSATKLQTSRTIWGQSFNGEGNVSGAITGATTGSFTSTISATTGIFSNLTTNCVPKHTAGGLTNGSIYDDGSIVSIAPTGAKVRLNSGDRFLEIDGYTNSKITLLGKTGSPIEIKTEGNSNQILLGTNGSVSIGTTTDAGYKLDVNGTLRATGTITAQNGIVTDYEGSSWLSMATRVNQIRGDANATPTAAHSLYCVKNSNGDAIAFGGLGVNTGFYGFTATRIANGTNGTDWSTTWDVSTGQLNHSGNLYAGGYISASNRIFTGYDANISNSISCSNWFRSSGVSGWYNASYGGGIYMEDSTYVKVSHNKSFWVNGNIVATGEVTAYSASDIRLKTNIKPIMSAIDVINKLNPVQYNWNNKAKELNPLKTDSIEYGLIAQELEVVMPELVHEIYNEYKSIDYVKLVPILIKGMQEQQIKIENLERLVKQNRCLS